MIPDVAADDAGAGPQQNWSGTFSYRATEVQRPTSLAELRGLVATSAQLRVVGTRHTFNDIGDSPLLVSLADLPGGFELDSAAGVVRVPGGARYGELSAYLDQRGWALSNLASLPHISVAGAVATATHGSGIANQSLASDVRGLSLLTSTGEQVDLDTGDPDFAGAVVNLGALGVVTELRLAIRPRFEVFQRVYEYLPWREVTGHYAQLMASGYSVSVMTNWADPVADSVWVKSLAGETAPGDRLLGAAAAAQQLHPTRGNDPSTTTPQLGVPGPWYERLPHFLLEFTPSTGAEMHSEYFVDRSLAAPAIEALRSIGSRLAPLLHSAELRTLAADELWLSPAYRQDCAAFHFTWLPEPAEVDPLVDAIEGVLQAFDPRPHWGKVFHAPARPWPELFPRLPDFVALAERLDPRGAFRNAFTARVFGLG